MWIVERMRYQPTDQPTNRPTDTAGYRGALSHLKRENKVETGIEMKGNEMEVRHRTQPASAVAQMEFSIETRRKFASVKAESGTYLTEIFCNLQIQFSHFRKIFRCKSRGRSAGKAREKTILTYISSVAFSCADRVLDNY